jgi:hypothetical protein
MSISSFTMFCNTLGVLNGCGFKFMWLDIDEIGLMITHIDDKGYLFVAQIGGWTRPCCGGGSR